MKIGAIIQARTSSTRLPGKVLKALPYGSTHTVLEQVIHRIRASPVNEVIVATSTHKDDDAIVEIAEQHHAKVFRGSLTNVLERFYLAAQQYQLDYIVRVTSDCPCLDPAIVKRIIEEHFQQQADFTSSTLKRTFPVGQDMSFFSFQCLSMAYQNAVHDYEKEHVTPYFYQSHPDKFKVHIIEAYEHQRLAGTRLTIDTPEDYHFLCAIFDELYLTNPLFSLDDIIKLLKRKPWLQTINLNEKQKKVHTDLTSEILEGIAFSETQSLFRLKKLLEDHLNKLSS